MKFNKTLTIFALGLSAAIATPRPPCNPATHCPRLSTECMACNPRLDSDCDNRDIEDVSFREEGFCVEPRPLNFNGLVFRQPYEHRCRRIVDPGYKDAPKGEDKKAENYVKACRDYEYTCNDGTCVKPKGLPKNCNRAECDASKKVFNLHNKKSNQNICSKHGGIRFDYLRCDNENLKLFSAGIQSSCEEGQEPLSLDVCKPGRFSGDDPFTRNMLLNFDSFATNIDGCDEICDELTPPSETPPCCKSEELAGICESIPLEFPTHDGRDQPPQGLILDLKTTTEENRCCCEIECTCFGDPHCSSFFGDYEITQADIGEFELFGMEGFTTQVTLSTLGIAMELDITLSNGNTYILNAEKCTNGEGIRDSEGNYITEGDDIGMYQQPDGDLPSLFEPVLFEILDQDLELTLNARCIHFKMGDGTEYDRIDVGLTNRLNTIVNDEEICCPSADQTRDIMVNERGATGFCVRTAADPGRGLPKSSTNRNEVRRLLRDIAAMDVKRPNHAERQLKSHKFLTRELAGDENAMEFCRNFVRDNNFHMSLNECVANVMDFGIASLEGLEAHEECYNYGNAEVFDPSNKEECDEGVMLQYRPRDSADDWEDLLFFDSDIKLCDDKIELLFEWFTVDGEPFDATKYELQLSYCYPSSQCIRNQCDSALGFDLFGVDVLYECGTTEILRARLDDALAGCPCDANPIDCVSNCVNNGVCPAANACDNE